jgi:ABC-type uncharacterized transport system involved in gliding motility auxiliary subunit
MGMGRTLFTAIASVLVVAGFLAAHVLLQLGTAGVRLDLTERGLYTLSPATRTALANLSEPVEIDLVYSRAVGAEFPAVRAHAARVREMLNAYVQASEGRVRVRQIDPVPFSQAEDAALAAGLSAVPANGPDPLYLGLIGRNLADDEAILPFLAPEQEASLEYDLTRLITGLDQPEPPTIGVLTQLAGMRGDGREQGFAVLRELARSYRIVTVPESFVALADGLDLLLMAHPPELSARQAYVIDQYLMRGGRALVLVDPVSRTALAGAGLLEEGESPGASTLPRPIAALGVSLGDTLIGDRTFALPVRVDLGQGRSVIAGQPLYMAIPAASLDRASGVTAALGRAVNVGAAGELRLSPVHGLTQTVLMSTSPQASRLDPALSLADAPPDTVLAQYQETGEALTLGVEITGEIPSAFGSQPVPVELPDDPVLAEIARAQASRQGPHLSRSEAPLHVVVLADTDLLDDGFYIDPGTGTAVADNGVLIANAVETLVGAVSLGNLRARAPALRPMTRVEAMRERAQTAFFTQQAELEAELGSAQARLDELRARGVGSEFLAGGAADPLSLAERAEMERLRTEVLEGRERLRAIEGEFRREIDALAGGLRALNIWAAPALVLLAGLALAFWRRRRARAAGVRA